MPKITISVIKRESDYMITAVNENGVARIRQFARDERDATHRAFGMSVVFDAFYDQLRYTVIENFNTLDHIGKHPAEARAAELTAQLATVTDAYNSANREKNEMIAAIESLKQEIAELRGELKMSYTADDPRIVAAFERTVPVDWRDAYDGETPLGIALDGLGDEVE